MVLRLSLACALMHQALVVVVSLEASLNTTMPPTKLTLTLNQTLTSAWSGAESAKAHCAPPDSIPEVCFCIPPVP